MHLLSSFQQLHVLPSAFGLDISDSSLKIIQLKRTRKHFQLALYVEQAIPEGVIVEGKIKDAAKLSALLQQVIQAYKPKGLSSFVVASISDEEVFLKQIQLPKLAPNQLIDTLFIEAERNVPIPLNEGYLSYVPLPKHEKSDHLDMLIAVARKENVDALSRILSDADLIPVVFEPEIVAAARSATLPETQKTTLILEIGANRTRLIPVTHGVVTLSGVVPFSATQVSSAFAEALRLNEKEARELVWTPQLLKNKKTGPLYEKALIPLINGLAKAITEYITFLANDAGEGKHTRVDRVLVSGGGARIPGIEKLLSLSLQLPVSIVDPWINVMPDAMKDTPELPREQSVRFTVAIGLALRAIQPLYP